MVCKNGASFRALVVIVCCPCTHPAETVNNNLKKKSTLKNKQRIKINEKKN